MCYLCVHCAFTLRETMTRDQTSRASPMWLRTWTVTVRANPARKPALLLLVQLVLLVVLLLVPVPKFK